MIVIVTSLGVYYPAMDQYRLPVMVMEKMQHSLRGLVEKSIECKAVHIG